MLGAVPILRRLTRDRDRPAGERGRTQLPDRVILALDQSERIYFLCSAVLSDPVDFAGVRLFLGCLRPDWHRLWHPNPATCKVRRHISGYNSRGNHRFHVGRSAFRLGRDNNN
jgi:hypothetical protein